MSNVYDEMGMKMRGAEVKRSATSLLMNRVKELEATADLNFARGRVAGVKYVRESLCNCEICRNTQGWFNRQIKDMEERMKKLENERINRT